MKIIMYSEKRGFMSQTYEEWEAEQKEVVNEPVLEICMLGGFYVYYGDEPVTFGRSGTKIEQLLQLMILYKDHGVAKERLISYLYDWELIGNKNNSLNTMIYRLRKRLVESGLPDEEYISIENGICRWVSQIPVQVDVLEFRHLAQSAELESNEHHRCQKWQEALELYRGELLPHIATLDWVCIESSSLKCLYENVIRSCCAILEKHQEYKKMLNIYNEAAARYPFDEWQVPQINCLIRLNDYDAAYQIYQNTVILYTGGGMSLSEKFKKLLKQMDRQLEYHETAFEEICKNLQEDENCSGGYFCTYPGFVDIFCVLRRGMSRAGYNLALILCGLEAKKQEHSDAFRKLFASVGRSLRRCDVYTEFNSGQYLILLMNADANGCDVVFERIRSDYRSTGTTCLPELWYQVEEVEG